MKKTFTLFCFSLYTAFSFAQIQVGEDIDGESATDWSGISVSMPDSTTVAIGAINNDGNGFDSGHSRIYNWNGSEWVQKGSDINGEAAGDLSGLSVSMPNANTIAIGAPENDDNGYNSGHVRIYEWIGSEWEQKGQDIDGESSNKFSGYSVSMPDANTVAIGAPGGNGTGVQSGTVRIFEWIGSEWEQKGQDIDGERGGDSWGHFVGMPNPNIVAIGAPTNDGNGNASGHVRIYEWNGVIWEQKGADLDGESSNDYSGWSVNMPDANTVAIGATQNDGSANNAGHVRIYNWNGASWLQMGSDIDANVDGDHFGWSISMPNSNLVAIGSRIGALSSLPGYVRIYEWFGSEWEQIGMDIIGEASADEFGFSVSMPDENTVAISALSNDGNGLSAGHVRIYTLIISSVIENGFGDDLSFYPNPTEGDLRIDLGDHFDEIIVTLKNVLGQEIQYKTYNSTERIDMSIDGESGVYFIEILSEDKKAVLRVVKE